MNLPNRYVATGRAFGGGQGIVTVWNDTFLKREVAVKNLRATGIGGSLRDEAALLAKIKSKHVVELLDLGNDSITGEEYMIMEYIHGADFSAYSPTDLRCLYVKLYQISCGLADIHSQGCLHRDIKPDNLKIDTSGIVKIIDFGIGSNLNPVATNRGRGSDGYRGPEYYLPAIHLTQKSDIFAFASTAFKFCFSTLDISLLSIPPHITRSFSTAQIGPTREQIAPEISSILDTCFLPNPSDRPTASTLKQIFAKHLLKGLHIAQFVTRGAMQTISCSSPYFRLTGVLGTLDIFYTNLDFLITATTGEVFINGTAAQVGMILPRSCVIIIGAGNGRNRSFIPFNVSHPEVIL